MREIVLCVSFPSSGISPVMIGFPSFKVNCHCREQGSNNDPMILMEQLLLAEVITSACMSVGIKKGDTYEEARPERIQLDSENIQREVFTDFPSPPMSD